MSVGVWIYDQIPGTHPTWTVAMYAMTQADADNAMKRQFGGGHRLGYWSADKGKIKANCGAASDAAQKMMRLEA